MSTDTYEHLDELDPLDSLEAGDPRVDGYTGSAPSGPVDSADTAEIEDLSDLGGLGDDAEIDGDDADRSTEALFEGDDGRLDQAQRRALVVVIKKRFVSAVADPDVWKTLVAHRQILRSRLNDLFMDLHLDLDREIAFKRQVTPETGGNFPTLLYDVPWGREDTILLVHLRSRLRNEQAAGNARVYVDQQDMLDAVEAHRPPSATDQVADRRRAQKSIDTLYKAGLLIGASTGDRFEVSPAIEVILPVETLRELLAWLRTENGTAFDAEDTTPSPEQPEQPGQPEQPERPALDDEEQR